MTYIKYIAVEALSRGYYTARMSILNESKQVVRLEMTDGIDPVSAQHSKDRKPSTDREGTK
jgi:hypothetical protein